MSLCFSIVLFIKLHKYVTIVFFACMYKLDRLNDFLQPYHLQSCLTFALALVAAASNQRLQIDSPQAITSRFQFLYHASTSFACLLLNLGHKKIPFQKLKSSQNGIFCLRSILKVLCPVGISHFWTIPLYTFFICMSSAVVCQFCANFMP